MTSNNTAEGRGKDLEFPADITFKSIFYNKPYIADTIVSIIADHDSGFALNSVESKNGKFISFTITARCTSEENLQSLCHKISSIEGFHMMF